VHIVLYRKEPTFWANKQQINIQLLLIYRSVGNNSNNDLLVVEPKTSENEGAWVVELPTNACYPSLQTAHSFHQQNPVIGGWKCLMFNV
jgi:hypothetical protein